MAPLRWGHSCYTRCMVNDFYKAYLKSDRWKKKRQQVFTHYGKRCYACRIAPRILHVHHLTYDRLGRENISDLIPLCVPCHKEITRLYRTPGGRQKGNRRVTMEFVRRKRQEKRDRTREASRRSQPAL